MAADGVDLVDEDDARRVLLSLLEEIAHAGRTHADEHLHEVGARDGEERNPRLARDGAREQGLARAGGAHQEHALGDASAELGELLRILEESDDLLELGRALPGEDRVEREKEQDQDRPEKERLVRLSHLGSSSGLGSIVAERDSCRRLDGNGPSEGFISGSRRKETPPLRQAAEGRSPSTQKTRPFASARSASWSRTSFGMCASMSRSATFFALPPPGRNRSPGRRPRSVQGNGASVTSTSTPSPELPAISRTRAPHW